MLILYWNYFKEISSEIHIFFTEYIFIFLENSYFFFSNILYLILSGTEAPMTKAPSDDGAFSLSKK